jgi:glycosyltransferase involved in cell wall biosynthesis
MPATRYLLHPRPDPGLLSLIIPAYNEEAVIPMLRERVMKFIDGLAYGVEVLVVDDGSSDRTLELLMNWSGDDRRIKVLGLARNFGHQAAVTAGLDAAGGDAAVIFDADLQDPLETIGDMVERYRQGYDVVYGQRISRSGESVFKRGTAWFFYRFMRSFIHRDLPPDAGDFRLISRACLDALNSMRETHRFLRGMTAWVGFPQTAVKYHRQPRVAGESKYPFWKMARFAWTAAVSFSPAPLRISLAGGMTVAVISLGYLFYAVARALFWHDTAKGWPSLVAVVCFIGGAILVSIGILGEYVGRIFEESKGRPLYIVSTRANCSGEGEEAEPPGRGPTELAEVQDAKIKSMQD